MYFIALYTLLMANIGICSGHYLDDYDAIGQHLPEIWLEMPFVGYFGMNNFYPVTPTRGTAPLSNHGGTAPSLGDTWDGIYCDMNTYNFRHWLENFSFSNLQSFTISMFAKQPIGFGPIWSSNIADGFHKANCYIVQAYEEADDRLNPILGKHRIHARCGETLSRALAVENCPIDQGAYLALMYDHEKNYMRLYCNDMFDQVSTTPGLSPTLGTNSWVLCDLHSTQSG